LGANLRWPDDQTKIPGLDEFLFIRFCPAKQRFGFTSPNSICKLIHSVNIRLATDHKRKNQGKAEDLDRRKEESRRSNFKPLRPLKAPFNQKVDLLLRDPRQAEYRVEFEICEKITGDNVAHSLKGCGEIALATAGNIRASPT
jgi:hypothetical protein